ncbi:hypothetical protein [Lederbergia panacisoli]|uniref:hypothetical protein n=1 Tax=Lederbergia panacisoli TaxID=1255251 RepID=UPI00214C2853|nr:hypothetical protein [Lederbergia panacisoli]MCR2821390.1 hypothetical protein [Lederbergia panacisoli]
MHLIKSALIVGKMMRWACWGRHRDLERGKFMRMAWLGAIVMYMFGWNKRRAGPIELFLVPVFMEEAWYLATESFLVSVLTEEAWYLSD